MLRFLACVVLALCSLLLLVRLVFMSLPLLAMAGVI